MSGKNLSTRPSKLIMYYLKHRPAERLGRRLPDGTSTKLGIVGLSRFCFNRRSAGRDRSITEDALCIHTRLLGLVALTIRLLRTIFSTFVFYLTRSVTDWSCINLPKVFYRIPRNCFSTLTNMGADPITISAKAWQGSHQSNHGGK